MLKRNLNNIFTITALITALFFVASIFFLTLQVFNNSGTDSATILSGILSMFGGALGALGAYLVARNQIEHEKKEGKIIRLSSELPVYISLSIEFKKIIIQLENLIQSKKERFKDSGMDNDFIRNLVIRIDAPIWGRWNDIKKITDSILLKELLEFEEKFLRTIEVLEYDIRLEEEKIIELHFKNKDIEVALLTNKIHLMTQKKYENWNEIESYLEKSKKLQNSILRNKLSIEKVIEGTLDIKDYQYISSKDDL